MSTAASQGGPAPWRSSFLAQVQEMDMPHFVLSTLQPAAAGSPVPYLPRSRTCVFRGFWAELPENSHNQAALNPRAYASELPVVTTDVRMEKVGQLFATGPHAQGNDDHAAGSGGGGPVEAVFWFSHVNTQWRIRGNAYVVAQDIEDGGAAGSQFVQAEIAARMRVLDEAKTAEWSWLREVGAIFGNQSPAIRGSFKAPPPGQPVSEPYDDKNLAPGSKVDDLDDPIARANFRVVIIKPVEVEHLELTDPKKTRRHLYTFDQASSEWKHEELWP